jgi:hypothetical protein
VGDLEVRPARADDAAGLAPLASDALSLLATLRGGPALLESCGLAPTVTGEELAARLCREGDDWAVTLVGTLDGVIVGAAVGLVNDDGLELIGVHTKRSLRRRRIGSELLASLRATADARDARFEALALPGDQTTKSLLESAGFRARLLRMSADR